MIASYRAAGRFRSTVFATVLFFIFLPSAYAATEETFEFEGGRIIFSSGRCELDGVLFGRLRFESEEASGANSRAWNRSTVSVIETSGIRVIGDGAAALELSSPVARFAFFAKFDSVALATILPIEFNRFIEQFRAHPHGAGRIEAKAEIESGILQWTEYKASWEGTTAFNPVEDKSLLFPFLDEFISGGATSILTPFDRGRVRPAAGQRLFKASIRYLRHFYDRQTIQVKFRDPDALADRGEFLMDYEERRPFINSILPFVNLPMALEYRVEGAHLRLLDHRLKSLAR
jgi:hypothetical protein